MADTQFIQISEENTIIMLNCNQEQIEKVKQNPVRRD